MMGSKEGVLFPDCPDRKRHLTGELRNRSAFRMELEVLMMKKRLYKIKMLTAVTCAAMLSCMAPAVSVPADDWTEGGWDEGGWDEGGWDEGGYDEGGWDEGGWDEGGFEEGGSEDVFDGNEGGETDQGGSDGAAMETSYTSVNFADLVTERASVPTSADGSVTGSSGAFDGTFVISAGAKNLVSAIAESANAQGGSGSISGSGGEPYVKAVIRFPDGVTVGSAEVENGLSSCSLEAESDYTNTVTVKINVKGGDLSSFLSNYNSDQSEGEGSAKKAVIRISYSGDIGSGTDLDGPSNTVSFSTSEEHRQIQAGNQPVEYSFDGGTRCAGAGAAEEGNAGGEEDAYTEGEEGIDTEGGEDFYTEGEEGIDTEGEEDFYTEGEEGIDTEGEEDFYTEGEDGIDTEGEGDFYTEGEDGIDTDTDDPYGENGADTDDPYGENGADTDDPYGENGADADDPYGENGTDADDPSGEEDGINYDEENGPKEKETDDGIDYDEERQMADEPQSGTESTPPEEGKVSVTYRFISETVEPVLPDEITELYLPAGSSVEKGTEVKAEWPTDLDKERPYYGETESGRWKFNGYDNDTATAGDEEIVFTGSWVYETPKTYTILNEAASTDETRPVPDDLPVYDTFTQNGYEGEVLTVVEPKEENKTFETEDGVWTYEYRDPETVTLGEEEELLITYYYSFSEAEPAEHEVSFVFESGTEGYEIPEELNIVCLQAPYMVPDGTEVEPDPIEDSPYEPEDGKGRWIFVGYEPEGSVVVDGEDVLFTGTWIYEEKLTYNVKSKCVSDTEGRSIPDGFPVHEAFKYPGYPGETLTPQEPLVDEYKTEDGVWNYSWTEPETVSLAEETELTILYHYEFTPTGTSTVTVRFESGPKKGQLPKPLDVSENWEAYIGSKVDAPNTPPLNKTYKDSSGTWTFTGFTPASLIVSKDPARNVFVGTWYLTAAPEKEYPVSYRFVSGTDGRSLPDAVLVYTPSDTKLYKKGTTVRARSPEVKSVKVEDGVWKFTGYTNSPLTVTSDPEKNVLVGVWTFKADPTYGVKYKFVSWSKKYKLPDAVKTLLPTDGNRYLNGTRVKPIAPSEKVVYVKQGAWRFEGYDKSSVVISGSDALFTGTWKFTPDDVFHVTYRFVSGTKGYDLPDSVMAYLPSDKKTYREGDVVKAQKPAKTTVTDGDVVWTFRGYDSNSKKVSNKDIVFTGTWTASKRNDTVTIQFFKKWVDNSNASGRRPQKILITLYKNDSAYQTYTCAAPSGASNTWSYTVRGLPRYENGREIHWTVDERPVEGYSKSVDGLTITNTLGNRTAGARTGDRNPVFLYLGIALAAAGAVVLVLVLGRRKK